jgi:hypothetical protein
VITSFLDKLASNVRSSARGRITARLGERRLPKRQRWKADERGSSGARQVPLKTKKGLEVQGEVPQGVPQSEQVK